MGVSEWIGVADLVDVRDEAWDDSWLPPRDLVYRLLSFFNVGETLRAGDEDPFIDPVLGL